jgi:alpha-1,2-mannosyltransferase
MKLPDGYPRLGLVAGAVMWVVWGVSCTLGTGSLDRNGQVIGTDHSAFHTAAVLIVEGHGGSLYDFPALEKFQTRQDEIIGKPGFLDPFRNPPFYALLYEPTAGLPYLASYTIWAIIGLAILAGGLRLIHGPGIGRTLAWALSFYPTFATVSFGQNTFLSFGAFALAYRAVVNERYFLAGIAAGILLYKPQLLFGLGIWWLVDCRRFWPALLGVAITGIALAGLSWAVLPGETAEWLRRLPDIASYSEFDFYNLHTSRGFGYLLTGDQRIGDAFGFAGLLIAVIWLVRFQFRHSDQGRLVFAAAIFATVWGSPHTMIYEWALLVIPGVILWDTAPEARPAWVRLFAAAWVALFVSTPLAKAQLAIAGVAIQLSVPILAWVALRTDSLLISGTSGGTQTCGTPSDPASLPAKGI